MAIHVRREADVQCIRDGDMTTNPSNGNDEYSNGSGDSSIE